MTGIIEHKGDGERFVVEYIGGSMDGSKSRGVGKADSCALPKRKIRGAIKREIYDRDDSSGVGGYWIYRYVGVDR